MKSTVLLFACMAIFISACGTDANNAQVKDQSLASRAFAPINSGYTSQPWPQIEDRGNVMANIGLDALEFLATVVVVGVNDDFEKKVVTSKSLMPRAYSQKNGALLLSEGHIEEIVNRYNEMHQNAVKSSHQFISNEIKVVHFDFNGRQVMKPNVATMTSSIDASISTLEQTLGDHRLVKASPEMKVLVEARQKLAQLQLTQSAELVIQSNGSAIEVEELLKNMEKSKVSLSAMNYTVVEKPMISMGRKYLSRTFYVFVVADIANDAWEGFDHRGIGWIGAE